MICSIAWASQEEEQPFKTAETEPRAKSGEGNDFYSLPFFCFYYQVY